MSSIATLRPDGTVYDGGVGKYPSGTVNAILSDNDDGSWVWVYTGIGFTEDFTSYGLAADQRCAGARFVYRLHQLNAQFTCRYRFEAQGNLQALQALFGSNPNQGASTYWGGWYTSRPQGGEWLQADIDSLRIYIETDASSGTAPAIHEEYVDLDIRTKPTAAITSPTTGQRLFPQQPTIYWNYNGQGDTVSRHRVKIFTAAVVGGGGFNADTSSTAWDSGDVAGAASSKQVGTPLSYGVSYYAYVKVATDFNGSDWWSNWTSVQFYINNPPTATAVITSPVTPITTTNRPNILWTYTDTDGEAQEYYYIRIFPEVMYSAVGFNPYSDAGATWVSGAQPTSLASGAQGSVQSGPLNPNVNYKAYVWVAEVGSAQRWSTVGISGVFTIQIAPGVVSDPPATPAVVSVTPDTTNQRAVVSVSGQDNMLTRNQASIDSGTIGWEPDANLTVANLVRDTTTYYQGGGSLKMTPTTNGTTMAARSSRKNANPVFPVTPLRTYSAFGIARSVSTGRNVNVGIRWYDAAMALLSTSTGSNVADVSTGFTQAFVTAVAPATAAWAEIVLTVVTPSEGHFWDNLGFAPGTSLTWFRGGLALELGNLLDSFDRADSATVLGTSDGGQAWTATVGTWGISGNKGYLVAGGALSINQAVLASTHLSDGYVQADITLSTVRAASGIIFHHLDANNFLRVLLVKVSGVDIIKIEKRVAGTFTILAQVTGAGLVLGATYTTKVEFFGGQVYVYINGTLRLSYLMLAGELNQFGAYNNYGLDLDYDASNVVWDDGGSRFNNFSAKLPKTQTVTIQRSLDAGVTWVNLRSAIAVALNDQLGTFYDYEVPPSVLAQYRMKTTGAESSLSYDSVWSATGTLSALLGISNWWLKDPLDPSLNMVITVAPPFTFTKKEPQTVYDPMGRKTSVVVTDGQKGIAGSLTVRSTDKATYDKLVTILGNGRTLFLQDILGRGWYVKFGDSQQWSFMTATPLPSETTKLRHYHEITLPFAEVVAP